MNVHRPPNEQAAGGPLVPAPAPAVPTAHDPYRSYGGYRDIGADQGGLDLRHYLHVLNKRKWLILSITAAFVVIGAVRTLMQTPLYTATVRLQIDRNVAKVVEGGNVTPVEGSDFEFLKTQYELLQSRTMAERVASALKLGAEPDFFRTEFTILGAVRSLFRSRPSEAGANVDTAALERAAAGVVLGNLGVRPVAGSRLVDVSYSDHVPARAQRVATAYGEAFIAFNLDKRFQATMHAKVFLEDQVNQLKLRLQESEKKLLEFAERERIVVVTEKSSIAENNLASANTALGTLVSERIRNEQLWLRIPMKPAMHSNLKPATCSDPKPARVPI